jgi:hypothetical protein
MLLAQAELDTDACARYDAVGAVRGLHAQHCAAAEALGRHAVLHGNWPLAAGASAHL